MESSERSGRYVTLRDYLRVLRRYRWAILALVVLGAAAGYIVAKRQQPVYQATATVAFQDPGSQLALVGYGSDSQETAAQAAQTNAETLTRPPVLSAAARRLGLRVAPAALAGSVSSQVSSAGLLLVSAESTSPAFAERLANAMAYAVAAQDNAQQQAMLKPIIARVNHQLTVLSRRTNSPTVAVQLETYENELARLNSLTSSNSSAQVVQPATVPGSPVAPTPTRDALIGLAIGLVLALLLAFVRDSLDQRLRTARDIESCLHLPILGHLRCEAMGQIPHLANGKSDHQVDLEAARILRRNLEFLNVDHPPRSVLVTSSVPEEGKTTVAALIAFAMAHGGKRTLLVECDMRRPVLATRLQLEPRPGLSDYLAGDATPEQILRPLFLGADAASTMNGSGNGNGSRPAESHSVLVCIPAGSPTSNAAELLRSNRLRQFLEEVSNVYDIAVIDSTPMLPVADALELIPQVDAVVVCAREHQTKREEALAAKRALARFPPRPTGLVITGMRPHEDDAAYAYSYSYS